MIDEAHVLHTAQTINDKDPVTAVGRFFMKKWRDRLAKSTQAKVLAQMQKQGIPPEVAAVLLFSK